MDPTLGWTVLSRDALRQAEAHLQNETEGVRDEIGFLNLHQAYANRFFPGTTVLQTRLRYVLFIPWMYNKITAIKHVSSAWRAIQEEEQILVRRLKHPGVEKGIIGGRNESRINTQPASMVYWTALQSWHVLRKPLGGNAPTRSQVHQYLEHPREILSIKDDDLYPLEEKHSLFVTLPQPPKNWLKTTEPLDFDLTHDEATWLRKQMMGIERNGTSQEPASVLAILAESDLNLDPIQSPWAKEILEIVYPDEREALFRAGKISALAAVGRAVYDALVEWMCNEKDQTSKSTIHREFLRNLTCETLIEDALSADIEKIVLDAPQLKGHSILHILRETQEWLRKEQDVQKLLGVYQSVEMSRKGRKAQLASNLAGQQRRAEWRPSNAPQSAPLSYRWDNVKQLLRDLRSGL